LGLVGGSVVAAGLAYYLAFGTASRVPMAISLILAGSVLALVAALSRRDAVSLLTVMLAALFLIPEDLVISGPLRSVGNPALLAGLACLIVWVAARWTGAIQAERLHPFRWTMLAFLITSLTAYAAALSRTLVTAESDSATRTIFPVLAMMGVAMLATDGLGTVDQIERLLKRFVFFATAEGVIGALEYFAKLDYHSLAHLPGLTLNTEVENAVRSGFSRVQAAGAHPIEFSVALALAVPLALHFALNGQTTRVRRVYGGCVALLILVIPLTVSRSGLLALAAGLAVYAATLKGRARANLAVFGALGLLAFPVVAPGILGTVRSFVLAGSKDNSITGRLDDYSRIPGLMDGHWWWGRGFGTFQPTVYFWLDNQYLMSLLTGGIVGLLSLASIYIVGAGVARGAHRRFSTSADRDLAQAVAGAIVALAVTAATFDQFSFYQCGFTLFMLGGTAAALWTIARAEERSRQIGTVMLPESHTHGQKGSSVQAPHSMSKRVEKTPADI
jgi:hypothetical protein